MLGNKAVKAAHAATSIASSTAKRYVLSDSTEALQRRSTFSLLNQSIFTQQTSTQQSQLLKFSFTADNYYNRCNTTKICDPMLLQTDQTFTTLPLPFIRHTDPTRSYPTAKMKPNSVPTLNSGLSFGINSNCYFEATEDVLVGTTLSNLLCQRDTLDRMSTSTDQETYDCMNRNARRGKRANKGKRACSRQARRKRRRRFGNHRR